MNFIDDIKEKARKDIKRIVLPETEDVRVLKATEKILQEGFAEVVLVGDEEATLNLAKENGVKLITPEHMKIINDKRSKEKGK